MCRLAASSAAIVALGLAAAPVAGAVPFTSSYTDGGVWNTVYAQGFSPSEAANPDPGVGLTDPVTLNRFEFFKSGNADAATNIRLAIVNNLFLNLDAMTTSSPELVGLSTNTIANTAGIATGSPITFEFDGLQLTYGENYAAIFVNENGGDLTHVLVSALTANYEENPPGSGMFLPVTNYGDPDPDFPGNYFLATSNFTHTDTFGTYFDTFGGQGDANFVAYFNEEPPDENGDYNGDGVVDAADYAVLRDGSGTTFPQGLYDVWAANFGRTVGASANRVGSMPVPEPATFWFAAWLPPAAWTWGRRRGRVGSC